MLDWVRGLGWGWVVTISLCKVTLFFEEFFHVNAVINIVNSMFCLEAEIPAGGWVEGHLWAWDAADQRTNREAFKKPVKKDITLSIHYLRIKTF